MSLDALAVIDEERRMRVRNGNRESARGNHAEADSFYKRAAELATTRAGVARLIHATQALLASASPNMCHRNKAEMQAYKAMREALSDLTAKEPTT